MQEMAERKSHSLGNRIRQTCPDVLILFRDKTESCPCSGRICYLCKGKINECNIRIMQDQQQRVQRKQRY